MNTSPTHQAQTAGDPASSPQQTRLEVLFTPADFAALKSQALSGTTCVVLDVLRATSSMITALAHGADGIVPVEEIAEALALRDRDPKILLTGERDGVRIDSSLTGGPAFDLGNSPREFTAQAVRGRKIAMTTTNGTKALRACTWTRLVLVACLLNLRATADFVRRTRAEDLLLVCSGTFAEAAYEDVLAAGALCDLLWQEYRAGAVADSALLARELFLRERGDLTGAFAKARNGRRLLGRPDLREDVSFCAQTDRYDLVALMGKDGVVRLAKPQEGQAGRGTDLLITGVSRQEPPRARSCTNGPDQPVTPRL